MTKTMLAVITALVLMFAVVCGQVAAKQILPGSLAKLDFKDAVIETPRGVPKGTLTVAQHFGLSPQWLDPQEQIAALTQQHYEYILHDALIKTMPQGLFTYSLAEHAEMTADFTKAAFRLRPGLKFHDGTPLTTADVQWSYENYRGVSAKVFKDYTERVEIVDDRTIIFHFNKPFIDFMALYNGDNTGAGWVVPKAYYQKVGAEGFKAHPIGAGPFKFVSQEVGVKMVFEAWEDYWRKTPGVKTLVVRGIGGPGGAATRLAGLKTGELDLAYGLTGKILPQVLKDENLRWNPNFTAPWVLFFPNWEDPSSPFHDKRVRQAVSLAINREFLIQQETQGLGVPWGNWIGAEFDDILQLPVPEYNPEKARKLLAEAGYAKGLQIDGFIPFTPYYDMGERILADLAVVGIKGSLQTYDGPQYRGKRSKGRKGYEGKATILKSIGMSPGAAASTIRLYGTCKASASFICDDRIEALWAKYNVSTDPEERKTLSQSIQRIVVEDYLAVPLYINPFVHAVGPKVLPEGQAAAGEGIHKYWASPQAPYPYPWEEWKVKE
jgi:peptide/nickel transport system substrate-binding protein